jgi:hypothetical protein
MTVTANRVASCSLPPRPGLPMSRREKPTVPQTALLPSGVEVAGQPAGALGLFGQLDLGLPGPVAA